MVLRAQPHLVLLLPFLCSWLARNASWLGLSCRSPSYGLASPTLLELLAKPAFPPALLCSERLAPLWQRRGKNDTSLVTRNVWVLRALQVLLDYL